MGDTASKEGIAQGNHDNDNCTAGSTKYDELETSTAPSDGDSMDDVGSIPSDQSSRGPPADTVFVFDWDDTLLCSSAINQRRWSPQQLQQLEVVAEGVLQTAMMLGETLIVTNGNESWVEDSSRRFLPKLVPLLQKVSVTSARSKYELLYPADPFAWKRQAFQEIFRRRIQQHDNLEDSGLNVIVIGDSPAEIEAAHAVTGMLGKDSLMKTVKFKDGPTVNELVGQLRRLTQELGKIVQQESSACKGLVRRQLPAHLDHMASWASGWLISES